jgi:hypothetical protein
MSLNYRPILLSHQLFHETFRETVPLKEEIEYLWFRNPYALLFDK